MLAGLWKQCSGTSQYKATGRAADRATPDQNNGMIADLWKQCGAKGPYKAAGRAADRERLGRNKGMLAGLLLPGRKSAVSARSITLLSSTMQLTRIELIRTYITA